MDRFNALGRGMQIMLVAAVLLLLDSLIFNWQEVSIDVLGVEASSGINAWHGFWGVVMGLLTIVLIAWIVARLAGVDIPLPVSAAMIGAGLAVLILLCAVIKNLSDDYSTFWSYVGIVLAALIAVGAWLEIQATGGIETLRSEMPRMGSSGTAASTTPPEPPAATAPPPPPPPPAASPPETAPEEPPTQRDT